MDYTFQFRAVLSEWPLYAQGAILTIRLSALSMIGGLFVGVICAVGRTYGPPSVRGLVAGYVELIRNTPFLVQLFVVYFALPSAGIRLDPNTAALLAMIINVGAYSAEIVRAGFMAIPVGQIEAARSLALKPSQILRFIILVPALQAVYPSLTSQFILVLLGSSIVSAIAAEELTAIANTRNASTFRSFEIYAVVSAIYIALAFGFRAAFAILHRLFLKRKAT